MKSIMALITAILLSFNLAQAKDFSAHRYVYMGTLESLVAALESDLSSEIIKQCGANSRSTVQDLSISLRRGSLAGQGSLEVEILNGESGPSILFPSHPFAELKASFECR